MALATFPGGHRTTCVAPQSECYLMAGLAFIHVYIPWILQRDWEFEQVLRPGLNQMDTGNPLSIFYFAIKETQSI